MEAIKKHCPDCPMSIISEHVVDGMSMLEQVVADKRRLRGDSKKLGPTYWNHLRAKYNIDNLDELLVVKNPEEQIDSELVGISAQEYP